MKPASACAGAGIVAAAIAAGFMLLPVAGTPPARAATAAATSPEFEQYCIGCHGPDARGIDNLGVDLVRSSFVAQVPEPDLVEFLKAGRPADDPANRTGRPMPGFGWVTDGELQALAVFLKSRNGTE